MTLSHELAGAFGIHPVFVEKVPGRMFMTHYRVRDAQGEEFFIKCVSSDQTIEQLDLLVSLHHHLVQAGFPVPYMKRTTSNESGFFHNGRVYTCFTYFPHDHSYFSHPKFPDTTVIQEAGALLGRLHNVVEDVYLEGETWFTSIHDTERIKTPILNLLSLLEQEATTDTDRLILRSAENIRSTLDDLPSLSAELKQEKQLLLHGDFAQRNVLLSNGHVSGCIDFSNCTYGHPAEDLAEPTLLYFGSWFRQEQDVWEPDRMLYEHFLQGYASVREVSQQTIEVLPRVLRAQCVRHLANIADRYRAFLRVPYTKETIERLICFIDYCSKPDHIWATTKGGDSMVQELVAIFSEMNVNKEFTVETTLSELGFTSIMIMELIVLMEEKFSIEIADEDLAGDNFQTIGTVLDLVGKYVKAGV